MNSGFHGRYATGEHGDSVQQIATGPETQYNEFIARINAYMPLVDVPEQAERSQSTFGFRFARLSENVDKSVDGKVLTSGLAKMLGFSRGEVGGGTFNEATILDLVDIRVFNPSNSEDWKADDIVEVFQDHADMAWVGRKAAPPGVEIVIFALAESLPIGGTASANRLACSGDAPSVFQVQDSIGKFKGLTGYRGSAFRHKQQESTCPFQIIELQEQAEMIVAVLGADIVSQGTAVAATVVSAWQGVSPGSAMVVAVIPDHVGLKAGESVIASYDESTGVYNIIEPHRPAGADAGVNVDEQCVITAGKGSSGAYDQPATGAKAQKIIANRDTLLRMLGDGGGDDFLIQLDPSELPNSVIHSDATGLSWTSGPVLNHNVQIGGINAAGAGSPFLRISGNEADDPGGGGWAFANRDAPGEQTWLRPKSPGTGGSLLFVFQTGAADDVVELAWTQPGVEATIVVGDAGSADNLQLQFENGLLIACTPTDLDPGGNCVDYVDPKGAAFVPTTAPSQNPCDD